MWSFALQKAVNSNNGDGNLLHTSRSDAPKNVVCKLLALHTFPSDIYR